MTVTQYSTNAYGTFVGKTVPTAVYMGGVRIAQKSGATHTGFEGFGVAITGSSCWNLMQMEAGQRHALLESIYGKNGLGLTTARLTIGASDYSAEVYTYDDVPDDMALEHFSIDRDRAYILPVIKEVLAINPDLQLFASPWSPPGWMKTGGSIAGGFMRRKYLDVYGDYFVKFLQAYAAEGIHIHAVTVQNECQTDQSGRMPACFWHPDLEAEFVSILRRKLTEAGLTTEIWFHDHNFNLFRRVDWMLKEHPQLQKDCNGIAFHYYKGAIENTRLLQENYPHIPLHFTEAGPRLYDNYATDWCKWGIMITKVLREGYRSFCGWNLMLDESGGPNIGPFFCGGLLTRHSQTGELSYSGQYRAFAHIASYVTKKSRITGLQVGSVDRCMSTYPKTVPVPEGVLIENEGQTVLLLTNPNTEKAQVQYFHEGSWYYIELMPDTLATVVWED